MSAIPKDTDVDSVLTEEAASHFLEYGWVKLDRIIAESELDWLRSIYDEFFDPDGSYGAEGLKQLGGTDEKGRATSPQILNPSKRNEELRNSRYLARLELIAQRLIGNEAYFRNDHMILKPAGYGTPTPWHQDQAYSDPNKIYTNINFWLPLEDATVENGCMHYVPGSHHGVIVPHEHMDPDDPQTALVAADQEYWSRNGQAVPCPAGSATLHHSYTMHYASGNSSSAPRRAYIAVFVAPPVERRYRWVFPWRERTT